MKYVLDLPSKNVNKDQDLESDLNFLPNGKCFPFLDTDLCVIDLNEQKNEQKSCINYRNK